MAMIVLSPRRTLLSLSLVVAQSATSYAQTAAPAAAPAGATAAWTIKTKGEVRWQQVTPAGALLISTDAELAGVDIERGQVTWEKPAPGGLPPGRLRGHGAGGAAGGARHDRGPHPDGAAGARRADGSGALVRHAPDRPCGQPRAPRAAVPVARQERPHLRGLRRPPHGLPPRRWS